ncbi:hypothetical protein OIO90_004605 [Microbotryomycetes sp. JL221]|nr:hypothetical protein OIO90_004605 [Microbotryomycetes sp. JL221]
MSSAQSDNTPIKISHSTPLTKPKGPIETSPLKHLEAHSDLQDLAFSKIVSLCNGIMKNRRLVQLALEQAASKNGRTVQNSAFNTLRKLLLTPDSTRDKTECQKRSTLDSTALLPLINSLDLLSPTSSAGAIPGTSIVSIDKTPLALMTRRNRCTQCDQILLISKSIQSQVHLFDTSGISTAIALRLSCSSKYGCNAHHWPDHIEISHTSKRVWVYDEQTESLKVGRNVYVTRRLAEQFSIMLELNHCSPGSFATMFNKVHKVQEESNSSKIESKHVWRAFVMHAILNKVQSTGETFVSEAEASTDEMVRLALDSIMKEKVYEEVLAHQCPECTRYKRYWKDGCEAKQDESCHAILSDSETDSDVEDSHKYTSFEELTRVDRSRIVNLGVMDGIRIGHRLCAEPECQNEPASKRFRFCIDHRGLAKMCGVAGCTNRFPREVDGKRRAKGVCQDPEHRRTWRVISVEERQAAKQMTRIVKHRRPSVRDGIATTPQWQRKGVSTSFKRRHASTISSVRRRGAETSSSESGSDDSDDATCGPTLKLPELNPPKLVTRFKARRIPGIEILVLACGTILAWHKLKTAEEPQEMLDFLKSVNGNGKSSRLPTFVAYDRSCHLLAYVADQAMRVSTTSRPSTLTTLSFSSAASSSSSSSYSSASSSSSSSSSASPSSSSSSSSSTSSASCSSSSSSTTDSSTTTNLPTWLDTTKLIVDAFHYTTHSKFNILCKTMCHPNPLNGSQPDLVVPMRKKKGIINENDKYAYERNQNSPLMKKQKMIENMKQGINGKKNKIVYRRTFNTSVS